MQPIGDMDVVELQKAFDNATRNLSPDQVARAKQGNLLPGDDQPMPHVAAVYAQLLHVSAGAVDFDSRKAA